MESDNTNIIIVTQKAQRLDLGAIFSFFIHSLSRVVAAFIFCIANLLFDMLLNATRLSSNSL